MAYRWPALAIEGGPMGRKVGYRRGNRYGKAELKQVAEALEVGKLGSLGGEKLEKMCNDFCAYSGARFTKGVSSGTAAIHVALGAARHPSRRRGHHHPHHRLRHRHRHPLPERDPDLRRPRPAHLQHDPASVEKAITRKTRAIVVGAPRREPVPTWTGSGGREEAQARGHRGLRAVDPRALAREARRHDRRRRVLLAQRLEAHLRRRRRARGDEPRRVGAEDGDVRRQELPPDHGRHQPPARDRACWRRTTA